MTSADDIAATADCRRADARRREQRRAALERRRRSTALFDCRSTISCSARSRCIARITRRTPCSCRRCCRSRPAAAPRTAATARRRRAITPASANEAMLDVDAVVAAARAAKDAGATRFCMGAAWRGPKERDLAPVLDMVREVKALGLETCCTLGMLKDGQAEALKRRRPRLLQPQPRHRARVLRRDRHRRATTTTASTRSSACATPASPSAAAASSAWARSRRAARRADRAARQPRSVSRVGADQPPGAGRRHAAARRDSTATPRSIRSSSCARSPWRASRCRRRWCGCPPAAASWARRCRRCASSPAPTRSSTATSC